MHTLTDSGRREGGYIISESEGATGGMRSRDSGVLLSGTVGASGMVVGLVGVGAATSAVKASGANTGNGTLTLDATTPVLAGAKPGIYTVRMTAATTYQVENPEGDVIGNGATGASFADDVKFAIAAGGTPFVAGDGFDITVAPGSSKYAPLDPAANNGLAVAAAVLFTDVDASAGDRKAVFHSRECEVHDAKLIWPAGISGSNKAAAIAALGKKGIIVRS